MKIKQTTIYLALLGALFSQSVISAPSNEDMQRALSIKDKLTKIAKYSIESERQQIEGRVIVHFENGKYKIVKSSGNDVLDINAEQIANATIEKMSDYEKGASVTIPIKFELTPPRTVLIPRNL